MQESRRNELAANNLQKKVFKLPASYRSCFDTDNVSCIIVFRSASLCMPQSQFFSDLFRFAVRLEANTLLAHGVPLCQLIVCRHCFFSLPGSFGALQNRTPAKVLCSIQPPHIIPPHHYNPQYPTSHDDVPKYDVLWVERLRISSSIFGQPLFRWKPQCSG